MSSDAFAQTNSTSLSKENCPMTIDLSIDDMTQVTNEAYSRCLRPFHPWSVRGMAMVRLC